MSFSLASSDRRPVDPPPIVELRVHEGDERKDVTFASQGNFFLFATLERSRPVAQGRLPQQQPATTPVLTGNPVAGAAYLDRPTPAVYFIFPDLSVRHEGQYRLAFTLFEEVKSENDADILEDPASTTHESPDDDDSPVSYVHVRCKARSAEFDVFSAKKFPGLAESTHLSRTVADQGCRVRIRRDVRMRRRDGNQEKDWDDFKESTEAEAKRQITPDAWRRRSYPGSHASQESLADGARSVASNHSVRIASSRASSQDHGHRLSYAYQQPVAQAGYAGYDQPQVSPYTTGHYYTSPPPQTGSQYLPSYNQNYHQASPHASTPVSPGYGYMAAPPAQRQSSTYEQQASAGMRSSETMDFSHSASSYPRPPEPIHSWHGSAASNSSYVRPPSHHSSVPDAAQGVSYNQGGSSSLIGPGKPLPPLNVSSGPEMIYSKMEPTSPMTNSALMSSRRYSHHSQPSHLQQQRSPHHSSQQPYPQPSNPMHAYSPVTANSSNPYSSQVATSSTNYAHSANPTQPYSPQLGPSTSFSHMRHPPPAAYLTGFPHMPTKRAYGTAFDTRHTDTPMRAGQRPDVEAAHHSDSSEEDLQDLDAIKMTYRRADGTYTVVGAHGPSSY